MSASQPPFSNCRFCEARLAGGELDHRLLALLLLGDLLGLDLDAGERGKFLDVFLQIVAARALGEDHLEPGAGVFLPVHLGAGGDACQHIGARGSGTGEHGATGNTVILHGGLPWYFLFLGKV